ncbi:hypothetical protein CBP36_21245 (plasmid) [Acidovorax carolinensis]|uniref:Bacterial shufflon protein N-terminal domain-containing protein n=1 Tax=Acidovorax carolinensis TaxID=553814 RepID=A0A240UK56_9BURK|nr:shufflon system plasmid conjugative transfer pilus tip adhesin PilV [Acidovorax carolinensis]ART61495.1 hypothetical protein CBP36_21245 [Acidovorax carolinensis]
MSEVLGLLFAIIVGLTFVPKLAELSQNASDNTRAVTTAQQQKKLIEASTAYIQQYSSTLQSTATATTPAVITVPMLKTVKLLDASFNDTNPYGQTWQTAVLQPTPGQLQALAMSYGGTTSLKDMTASKIAGLVGAQGGFIPKNDSGVYAAGNAYGSFSGWTISTANYPSVTGGRLASLLTFNNGQLNNNYLYRNAVPGNPGVNTMNTPILMGAGATVVANAACTSVGAIARDASGKMMSCLGGQWKPSSGGGLTWKGTIATVGALPTSGNAAGDTYRISGLSNHAFTWDSNSSVWQGLVVDQWGSLVLPGVIYANGSNSNYGAITMLGQKNGWSGINFKDSSGVNQGTLMMNGIHSGFYNAQDNAWRFLVDNAGNATVPGRMEANALTVNGGGSVHYSNMSTSHDDWALVTYASGWNGNSEPRSGRASIYTNDVYLRSAGRWASESSIDILEGPHYIAGLKPGKKYLVSVYGVTEYRTNNDATMLPVQVRNSWGGVIGQSGPGVWINWHDGNAPQSATMMIYAPPDGVVYGFTDRGAALYMSAIGG